MVKALIELSENSNRVLNVIKAKYELHDKSEAIEFLVSNYIRDEPELKPEFLKKFRQAMKKKSIRVDDFERRY